MLLLFWVAISNSTDTNSKLSETRIYLSSTHFNLDQHKLDLQSLLKYQNQTYPNLTNLTSPANLTDLTYLTYFTNLTN
jgi:hypothetical protein